MLRCRDISKLVSESMERKLSFRERVQLAMHLAMCRLCAGFARQIRLLRTAARQDAERIAVTNSDRETRLSPEARQRIKAALRKPGS
jgi:hypothetical protein